MSEEVERHVNAWIEDGDLPLIRGQKYRFGVNIGRLRQGGLVSAKVPEIDWGNNKTVEIIVILSGRDFFIEPRSRQLNLSKTDETDPMFFTVTPLLKGLSLLRVSLYLARELALLEEFEIPLTVEGGRKAA